MIAPDLEDSRLWPGETKPCPAGLCMRIKRTVCGRTMEGEAAPVDTGSRTMVPAGVPNAPVARITGVAGRTVVATPGRIIGGTPAKVKT